MFEFKGKKELAWVGRSIRACAFAKRTPLVVLRNVRLEACDGVLTIQGTDMENTLTLRLNGTGDMAPVLLPTDDFLKAIKGASRLSVDEAGNLSTDGGTCCITPGPIEDFPELHQPRGRANLKLRFAPGLLGFASQGASLDATKPSLSTFLIELPSKGRVALLSTDGFRMAIAESNGDESVAHHELENVQALIPASAHRCLGEMLKECEEVNIYLQDEGGWAVRSGAESWKPTASARIRFEGEGWCLDTRGVKGQFPQWRKVVPAQFKHWLDVDARAMQKAIAAVMKLRDEYCRLVDLYFAEGHCQMLFRHPERGRAAAGFGYESAEPQDLVTHLNGTYLEEMATRASTIAPKVRCHYTDGRGVIAFESPMAGFSCRVLLMPDVLRGDDDGAVLGSLRQLHAQALGRGEGIASSGATDEIVVESCPNPEPAPDEQTGGGVEPEAPSGLCGDGETVEVYRQDAKVVKALGGRVGMKAYPVARWDVRVSHGFSSRKPICWMVPRVAVDALGLTPISEAEAADRFKERSSKAREISRKRTAA